MSHPCPLQVENSSGRQVSEAASAARRSAAIFGAPVFPGSAPRWGSCDSSLCAPTDGPSVCVAGMALIVRGTEVRGAGRAAARNRPPFFLAPACFLTSPRPRLSPSCLSDTRYRTGTACSVGLSKRSDRCSRNCRPKGKNGPVPVLKRFGSASKALQDVSYRSSRRRFQSATEAFSKRFESASCCAFAEALQSASEALQNDLYRSSLKRFESATKALRVVLSEALQSASKALQDVPYRSFRKRFQSALEALRVVLSLKRFKALRKGFRRCFP